MYFVRVPLLTLFSLTDDLRFLYYHENVNIAGFEYIYRETLFDQKLECVAKDLWTNNFVDRLSEHGPLESKGQENFPILFL